MYTDLIVNMCVPEFIFMEFWMPNTNANELLEKKKKMHYIKTGKGMHAWKLKT